MTDKEIRLEIAKAALMGGQSLLGAKSFYKWVTAEKMDMTEYDNISIEVFASGTNMKGYIIQRCINNGIATVGDLIRMGGVKFGKLRNVGRKLVGCIDEEMDFRYGITNWRCS